jgi:alkylation response protein AidB-like acyl-CoA dehydrogenase
MDYLDLNMNLSEEEIALKKETNKFAREVIRPLSIQLDRMTPDEAIAPESPFWDFMRKAYELGFHKITMPEEFGGAGLTPLQQALVMEELAWGSFGLTLGLNAGAHARAPLVFDNKDLIKEFTIPYCECTDGSNIGCWAITEPDHGSDTILIGCPSFRDPKITSQCQGRQDGDEWVIEGQKAAWVSGGTIANYCLLMCQIDPSMGHAGGGIFVLPLNLPGVTKGNPLDKIGTRDLNQGEIFFDEVRIPKKYMLAGPEQYENALEGYLCRTTTMVAVYSTGLARAGFEEALAYARKRVQGGKPLIEHPTVQRKLFDMFVKVESSRHLSRAAFVYNRTSKKPVLEYGIAAKTYATQSALEVTSDAVQIFGGIGISKDYLVEKLFRDARATLICDGSNDILEIAGGNIVALTYPRKP